MFSEIKSLLLSVKDYVSEDGQLLKAKIEEDVINGNKNIIKLFLANKKAKEVFFEEMEGVLIFKWKIALDFLNMSEFLPDSYTKYKNKIGLTNGREEYLHTNKDVVLSFPYKDCILQGGQVKDEEKRFEIFYNEIIAKEEIGKMLEPKVFCNVTRCVGGGGEPSSERNEYKDGDNLIIKGNNLIALYSILVRFEGKIKCIYIDPPYNTGNDSFKYNDSFNHSTWLTFMKNRLEVARRLLKDDGVIFVQCDDNEQAYLKVLMDEVFSSNNYLNTILIKAKANAGASGGGEDKRFKKNYEFLLIYAKNYSLVNYQNINSKISLKEYIKQHKDKKIGFYYTRVITNYGKRVFLGEEVLGNGDKMQIYEYNNFTFSSVTKLAEELAISEEEVYKRYLNDIFMVTNAQTSILKRLNKFVNKKYGLISYEYTPKSGKMKNQKEVKFVWNETLIVWLKDTTIYENNCVYKLQKMGTLWDDISWGRLDLEGNISFKSGKKPEALIQRIMSIFTHPGDIVLDFFMGSGTTCAVAHKMGRQYIGIEQMDYIKTISLPRLIKVLEGEIGGISKAVNWNGGGSFIYCELKEDNISLIEKVQSATEENIQETKNIVFNDPRIIPYITKEELIKSESDFDLLSLQEKKNILLKLINKNKLYVSYSDLDDESVTLNERDREFNRSFYEVDEN